MYGRETAVALLRQRTGHIASSDEYTRKGFQYQWQGQKLQLWQLELNNLDEHTEHSDLRRLNMDTRFLSILPTPCRIDGTTVSVDLDKARSTTMPDLASIALHPPNVPCLTLD